MLNYRIKISVLLLVVFANLNAIDTIACIKNVYECAKKVVETDSGKHEKLSDFVKNFEINSEMQIDEIEIASLCDEILDNTRFKSWLAVSQIIKLGRMRNELIDYLKGFVATTTSFVANPCVDCGLGYQNTTFNVVFKNADGQTKQRKYQLNALSLGLKLELSLKAQAIVILGKKFNYYDTRNDMNLGIGFDFGYFPVWRKDNRRFHVIDDPNGMVEFSSPGVSFARFRINELGCSILMLGLSLDISRLFVPRVNLGTPNFTLLDLMSMQASVVFGGTLKPVLNEL